MFEYAGHLRRLGVTDDGFDMLTDRVKYVE